MGIRRRALGRDRHAGRSLAFGASLGGPLFLQLQADLVDPKNDRGEPGEDERIGDHVFAVDVETAAEETDEDDNR